jgi:peptidoglycan/xylan/chitin deacetylase (PgdA/CDA1 family)
MNDVIGIFLSLSELRQIQHPKDQTHLWVVVSGPRRATTPGESQVAYAAASHSPNLRWLISKTSKYCVNFHDTQVYLHVWWSGVNNKAAVGTASEIAQRRIRNMPRPHRNLTRCSGARLLESPVRPCENGPCENEMNPWPILVSAGAITAAGVATWGAIAPSAQLFGPTVRHTGSGRTLALTFDDGPNPEVTPDLLHLLDRHAVRGTFFLVGKFARSCPDLVREIRARGHVLGNHTDTHPNLIFQPRLRIREELERCQEAVASATRAEPPHWMRPPYGFRGPVLDAEVRRSGFRGVVMWSVMAWDWKPQPQELLIHRLARAARPGRPRGDILLLHDGDHRALGGDRRHVVAALGYWLPRWRDAGLDFVTMDGLEAGAAIFTG